MEPLGFYMYFKNNKKRVLTMILTLVLSAFLIVAIGVLGNSVSNTGKLCYKNYEYFSVLWSSKKIPKEITEELNKNPYIDRMIKGCNDSASVRSILGNSMLMSGINLEKEDLNYMVNKMGINIDTSGLDYGDFIGSKMLLKNVGLKVGDSISNKNYGFQGLSGKHIIKAEYDKKEYMFFILNKKETMEGYNGEDIYIFPKEGKMTELNNSLKRYTGKDIFFVNREKVKEDNDSMVNRFNKLLNIFSIVTIIIISIIMGNSYYLHYMERKSEFGTLKALGYKKSYILKRMLKEIGLVNVVGAVIYFSLLETFMITMNIFFLRPKGLPDLELYKEGIISLICLPLFVFIFALIPIYVLLGKMDSISIIERMD